jgi:hypothetical protein
MKFLIAVSSLFLSMYLFAEYSQKEKEEKLNNFIKATKEIDNKLRKYEKNMPENILIDNKIYNIQYNADRGFKIINFLDETYCNTKEILISKNETSSALIVEVLKIKCINNNTNIDYETTAYFKEPVEDL